MQDGDADTDRGILRGAASPRPGPTWASDGEVQVPGCKVLLLHRDLTLTWGGGLLCMGPGAGV